MSNQNVTTVVAKTFGASELFISSKKELAAEFKAQFESGIDSLHDALKNPAYREAIKKFEKGEETQLRVTIELVSSAEVDEETKVVQARMKADADKKAAAEATKAAA